MASSDIRSSVPLQISLYFHDLYTYLVFIISILGFIWKGVSLPYPDGLLGLEISIIVAYLLVDKARMRISSRGNKTEMITPLAGGIILAIFVGIFHGYYLLGQAYVLRIDQVVHGIGLVWVILELLMSILAAVTFLAAPQVY